MKTDEMNDVEFLTHVTANLVDHKDAIKVDRVVDDKGVLLTLHVHPEDMGKVIGREGATAHAIRTVLRGKGRKMNAHISVKIAEPKGYVVPLSPMQAAGEIEDVRV